MEYFFLYNIGQNKVLFSGATYGTQATLENVGHYVWIEKGNNDFYRLHSSLRTAQDKDDNSNGYIFFNQKNLDKGITTITGATSAVFDDGTNDQTHWYFYKVNDDKYNDQNV